MPVLWSMISSSKLTKRRSTWSSMSLFRVFQRTTRSVTSLSLSPKFCKYSTEATGIEKQVKEKEKDDSGEIAIQPVRDVMVADVISGAPSASWTNIICTHWMLMISQLNYTTVRFASTDPQAIRCNLAQASLNGGELTGIFLREVGDGRIPLWATLVREYLFFLFR